ncbi:MAG: hypothetical protein HYS18_07000, partial [Burkholderiales bacterium]|nr:hypothetical protein [Burkholderiales bacterium]
ELEDKLPQEGEETSKGKAGNLWEVCISLQALLSDSDAQAVDLFEQHASMFETAFVEKYEIIRSAIDNFDFGTALTALQNAMQAHAAAAE